MMFATGKSLPVYDGDRGLPRVHGFASRARIGGFAVYVQSGEIEPIECRSLKIFLEKV